MPLLGFTGVTSVGPFYATIAKEIKTQTCRKPRKIPIKPGDKLYLYWKLRTKYCWKIGEATCYSVRHITYKEFAYDGDFAKRDGFRDSAELREWFGPVDECGEDRYDVITWENFKG